MAYKATLFDVDGVLTIHAESFSTYYARQKGIDYRYFREFFQGDFQQALIGEADLRELIQRHHNLWRVEKDVDTLLEEWFTFEDLPNEPLIKLIKKLKARNTPCYLATNQEQYRGKHLVDTMFAGLFDGYFVSAFVGAKKPSREFFSTVVSTIAAKHPPVKAKDILFIDDSPEHVAGAMMAGINAHLYVNFEQARCLLEEA